MNKINKYYEVTEKDEPRKNVKYFVENIKVTPSKAVDLGCGQGNDTLFLIKNGWNVLGIDRENVEERIRKRLSEKEFVGNFLGNNDSWTKIKHQITFLNSEEIQRMLNSFEII